ncbi:MAG: hypothetical protein WCD47_16230 [Candidatus Sulfotelmatobacter sp.]
MKRFFGSFALACILMASISAFAQDSMKQDSTSQDSSNQDTMKKDDSMKKDTKKTKKTKAAKKDTIWARTVGFAPLDFPRCSFSASNAPPL